MRIEREKDSEKLEKLRRELPSYVSEYIEVSLDNLTPTTVLSYTLDIEDFLEWVWQNLASDRASTKDITLDDLDKLIEIDISMYRSYLKNRKDSHNVGHRYYKTKNKDVTISRKISALKNLFEYLTKNTNRETRKPYLSRNILEDTRVSIKKATSSAKAQKLKDHILRNEELEDFQDFIMVGYGEKEITNMERAYWRINKIRDAAIISLLLGSGLRVGELTSIRLKDLNVEERKVMVDRKRNKEDVVFFPKQTQEYLREYLLNRRLQYKADESPTAALFVTKYRGKCNPISKNTVQKMVMKYAKYYGKELSAHMLRHSFGTFLYNKTGNIRGVQKALGHSSMETSQIYTHMFEDDEIRLIDEAFDE